MSPEKDKNEGDQIDPAAFQQAFDEAEQSVDRLHSRLADGLQQAGYIREALKTARRIYSALAVRASEEPELIPLVTGAIEFARAIAAQIRELDKQIQPRVAKLHILSASAFSFTSTASIIPSPINVATGGASPLTPPSSIDRDRNKYAERLGQLNPALGNTFRQAWESYHGSRADPLRPALFLMRQTFDHFFEYLAPDEKVRSSQFWRPKIGDKPLQVYRTERIEYAAFTHIKDEAVARVMAASAKQLNEAYNALNKAHDRGELHPEEDATALITMSRMLEDWIDAIGLPGEVSGPG